MTTGGQSEWSKSLRVDSRGRKQYEGKSKPTFVEVSAKKMFDLLASAIPRKEFEEASDILHSDNFISHSLSLRTIRR